MKQVAALIVVVGLIASACGTSEPQSAGIAESPVEAGSGGAEASDGSGPAGDAAPVGSDAGAGADPASGDDASNSEPPSGGEAGIDNAELARQLLLDDSVLEGEWTVTASVDDNSADAIVEASMLALPECDATEAAFGADILTADSLGEEPAAHAESPTYESSVGDTVDLDVEIYADPEEPAEYFRLFEEANLEVCLTLVSEELFTELLAGDPTLTVLPLSSRRVRAPAGNDDVFAIELIAPVEVSGADDLEVRIAFFLLRRGGVVLSATVSHSGDVDVDAVLLSMHDRLDEVLGQ